MTNLHTSNDVLICILTISVKDMKKRSYSKLSAGGIPMPRLSMYLETGRKSTSHFTMAKITIVSSVTLKSKSLSRHSRFLMKENKHGKLLKQCVWMIN